MSMRALLLAVRDTLQGASVLNLDANSCEVMFDGEPKPGCGELYVAVWPDSWRPTPEGDGDLDETFAVNVTVTRRLGYSPKDRWGTEVLTKITTGLDVVCRTVVKAIHKNETLRELANTTINTEAGGTRSGFVEPLIFMDASKPQLKGPDWFSAPMPEVEGQYAESGIAVDLRFGKARRVQRVGAGYDVS